MYHATILSMKRQYIKQFNYPRDLPRRIRRDMRVSFAWQFCKVNGALLQIKDVTCGVPQDSCLGPLLFLIYINDLPRALRTCKVTMYADDTSLSFASNNVADLNRFMNEDLNCLKDWLQGNKLSLNVLKTLAMVVGSRPKLKRIADEVSGQPSFFINGTQIETVERTKYFGVHLDCHLVWDEHISV